MDDQSIWSRAFGGGTVNDRAAAEQQEWESLTSVADAHGVQWVDLVQDGYRVSGDRTVGGLTVHYDWRWRAEELRRRIDAKTGSDPSGPD